jgi:hypothetical protein
MSDSPTETPTDETLRAYQRDRDTAIERAEKAEKELARRDSVEETVVRQYQRELEEAKTELQLVKSEREALLEELRELRGKLRNETPQFKPETAHARRIAAGKRLIDIAIAADCSPATVRTWEFGATVRPDILARFPDAYDSVCGTPIEKP